MYRMKPADNYIILFGNTDMVYLRNDADRKGEGIVNFAQLPEEIKHYINGTGKGKPNIFYEPVGGINYILYGANRGGDVIWYQTLRAIIPTPSIVEEIDGGKKPSRRKTRKNRRKY